jgi:hypothetical protein
LGVLLFVVTVRIEVPVPPAVSVMLAALSEKVGPLLRTGERVAVRLAVPENPLRLVSVIVDVPEEPFAMDRLVGLAAMLKLDTRRITGAESVRAPLVAVTVMV